MRDRLSELPALLTYPEVGEQLRISLAGVKRLVNRGDLPTVTVGQDSRRVRRADLADYIGRLAATS